MNKEIAHYYIDIAAGEARSRYITTTPGQEGTYVLKSQQATEYKNAGYQGPIPPLVNAEVRATGMTGQQAADMILAIQEQWIAACAEIEYQRRLGKVNVDNANTGDEIVNACETAVAALRLI